MESGASQAERNKSLVREYMELTSAGDIEAAMALFDDSATWWVAGSLPGISGLYPIADYSRMSGSFAKECEGGRIPLIPKENGFTAEGDKVAVEARTHVKVSNGKTYDNEYHFVFEVRDGRIQAVREYLDSDHARSIFLD